eukprot:4061379-Prymnesium_polylepis.1
MCDKHSWGRSRECSCERSTVPGTGPGRDWPGARKGALQRDPRDLAALARVRVAAAGLNALTLRWLARHGGRGCVAVCERRRGARVRTGPARRNAGVARGGRRGKRLALRAPARQARAGRD